MRRISVATVLALSALLLAWAPSALRGQQPAMGDTAQLRRAAAARLGVSLTPAEILDRLRQSGITRADARSRLQQMGYDPSLADPYYDALEGGGSAPTAAPTRDFLSALRRLGISGRADLTGPDSARDTVTVDTAVAETVPAKPVVDTALQVFGRSLFQRPTNQFAPLASGPVDPGYRLGPGDRLSLILSGDVEQAYDLEVTRDGYVVIPDVGQVLVNGITLAGLDDLLYSRLGRVYSGVRRGGGATTHFQVTLSRVRAIQVYLVGEVVRPGAYQVSGVSTVFDALYRAGGPSDRGSFRRIAVRRGAEATRNVDIYSYLLHGDSRDDIRLEQGDIIFVPVAERAVRIEGAIRRPGIYELKPGEGLQDAIAYAGGLEASAVVRRVQIDRVLPPERRGPGLDRVLLDVDVARATTVGGEPVQLQDADIVHVFAVSDERRHRVVLTGGVNRPGIYEWNPGTTLWQLIDRAQGLDEQAYTARAHIFRLNAEDGSRRLLRVALMTDSANRGLRDVALADRDSVVVYTVARLANPAFVSIDGFVKRPGNYALADGMTLEDLILQAGGFARGAQAATAEVARYTAMDVRSDTTATVVRVPLQAIEQKGSPGSDGEVTGRIGRDVPAWVPTALEFQLREGDRVFIRRAPGYLASRQVKVMGEVMSPGTYVLRDREEKLSDLVERSGGLTRQAYAAGFQLFRKGRLLPTDLQRAVTDSRSRYNVVLEAGDSLAVPAYDPTVLVTGNVAFESRVLYRPGQRMEYYVRQAGGFADRADRSRTSVAYANGERAIVGKLLFFRRSPTIRPGSTIFVPPQPAQKPGFNWDNFLSRTLAVMSTTATLLIALNQLK